MISKLLTLPLCAVLSTNIVVGSSTPLNYSTGSYNLVNSSSIDVISNDFISDTSSFNDIGSYLLNNGLLSVSYDTYSFVNFAYVGLFGDYYSLFCSPNSDLSSYMLVFLTFGSSSSYSFYVPNTTILLETPYFIYNLNAYYHSGVCPSSVPSSFPSAVSLSRHYYDNPSLNINPIVFTIKEGPYNPSLPFENTFLYFLKTYITPVFGDFSSYYIVVGGNLIYPFDFLYYLSISFFILWLFVYVPYFFLRKLIKGGKKK